MEISMSKLQQAFDNVVVDEEYIRAEEIFTDVIFSDVVSIKELKEKGYTAELLLSIAARSDGLCDNLERMDTSVSDLSQAILEAPVVKGARKLF